MNGELRVRKASKRPVIAARSGASGVSSFQRATRRAKKGSRALGGNVHARENCSTRGAASNGSARKIARCPWATVSAQAVQA